MPHLTLATKLTLLLTPLTTAQFTPVTNFFNPPTFPNVQPANVSTHLTTALSLASTSGPLYQFFLSLSASRSPSTPPSSPHPPASSPPCPPSPPSSSSATASSPPGPTTPVPRAAAASSSSTPSPPPRRGRRRPSVLLPALARFGYAGRRREACDRRHARAFRPLRRRARVLQERFGAVVVYASAKAWEGIPALVGADGGGLPAPPARDRTLVDGETLVVGDVAFEVVLTPGHRPGTVSLVFPVWDEDDGGCTEDGGGSNTGGAKKSARRRGAKHMAGVSGGTATPAGRAAREEKVRLQERFAAIAWERGVDVLLSNHHVADGALWNADLLKYRVPGAPNPFVVGVDGFERYMRINAVSTRVIAAREGMGLDV